MYSDRRRTGLLGGAYRLGQVDHRNSPPGISHVIRLSYIPTTGFEIIGKSQSHVQNKAQRLHYDIF